MAIEILGLYRLLFELLKDIVSKVGFRSKYYKITIITKIKYFLSKFSICFCTEETTVFQ